MFTGKRSLAQVYAHVKKRANAKYVGSPVGFAPGIYGRSPSTSTIEAGAPSGAMLSPGSRICVER